MPSFHEVLYETKNSCYPMEEHAFCLFFSMLSFKASKVSYGRHFVHKGMSH